MSGQDSIVDFPGGGDDHIHDCSPENEQEQILQEHQSSAMQYQHSHQQSQHVMLQESHAQLDQHLPQHHYHNHMEAYYPPPDQQLPFPPPLPPPHVVYHHHPPVPPVDTLAIGTPQHHPPTFSLPPPTLYHAYPPPHIQPLSYSPHLTHMYPTSPPQARPSSAGNSSVELTTKQHQSQDVQHSMTQMEPPPQHYTTTISSNAPPYSVYGPFPPYYLPYPSYAHPPPFYPFLPPPPPPPSRHLAPSSLDSNSKPCNDISTNPGKRMHTNQRLLPRSPYMENESSSKVSTTTSLEQQEQLQHRKLKNELAREKERSFKRQMKEIGAKAEEDRTEEEKEAYSLFEERRQKKNIRSRQRTREKREEMQRILCIPEERRTEEERRWIQIELRAKKRKNEGDRRRRERIKNFGKASSQSSSIQSHGHLDLSSFDQDEVTNPTTEFSSSATTYVVSNLVDGSSLSSVMSSSNKKSCPVEYNNQMTGQSDQPLISKEKDRCLKEQVQFVTSPSVFNSSTTQQQQQHLARHIKQLKPDQTTTTTTTAECHFQSPQHQLSPNILDDLAKLIESPKINPRKRSRNDHGNDQQQGDTTPPFVHNAFSPSYGSSYRATSAESEQYLLIRRTSKESSSASTHLSQQGTLKNDDNCNDEDHGGKGTTTNRGKK